jgi:hypothetical protein
MISTIRGGVARHRRAILLGGVLLAAAEATLIALAPETDATWFAFLGVMVVLLLLSVVGFGRVRPAAFIMRAAPPAFIPPARPGTLFSALAALTWAGWGIGSALHSVRIDHHWPLSVYVVALYPVVMVLVVHQAWHGYDVSVRPDGLYDRRGLGTLVVPWDAEPAARLGRRPDGPPAELVFPPGAYPAEHAKSNRPETLRLEYRRPELVRRRGLVLRTTRLFTDDLDAQFLANVIGFYAAHPEHRAGIGTEGGHRRLQQALAQGPE